MDENTKYDKVGDVSTDPAYKCPYCGGRNCEFDEADEPGEHQGYFHGSQFNAQFWCNDCERFYDVVFRLSVTSVTKKEM